MRAFTENYGMVLIGKAISSVFLSPFHPCIWSETNAVQCSLVPCQGRWVSLQVNMRLAVQEITPCQIV